MDTASFPTLPTIAAGEPPAAPTAAVSTRGLPTEGEVAAPCAPAPQPRGWTLPSENTPVPTRWHTWPAHGEPLYPRARHQAPHRGLWCPRPHRPEIGDLADSPTTPDIAASANDAKGVRTGFRRGLAGRCQPASGDLCLWFNITWSLWSHRLEGI